MTTDPLVTGLSRALREEWNEPVEIDNLQQASTGARRQNVLFDALRGGERIPLVATVTPNRAMQVMDVDVEVASLRLAQAQGMPVPHVHGVWQDESYVGGPFFISSRVEGDTLPRQILRKVEAQPELGPRLARQSGEALARLHSADPAKAHPDLPRPPAGRTLVDHTLLGIETLVKGLLQPSPTFRLGVRWLEQNAPDEPPSLAVLHGDFRNGNIIVDDNGLAAVLDWEVGQIGDPMKDVSWLCMRMWRFRNDALEVGGFGSRSELRAGYEAAGGQWRQDAFHWWKTVNTLSWGLGLAGQAKAHLDGSVPHIIMAASGRRVAELEHDLLMLMRPTYE